jgi:ribonucleoside-triphosphate reductase
MKGVGKLNRTSSFPCGIFKMSKEINRYEGTPNYDLYQLALKCTAKRLYPNYANLDWSGNAGYDKTKPEEEFATMGKQLLI